MSPHFSDKILQAKIQNPYLTRDFLFCCQSIKPLKGGLYYNAANVTVITPIHNSAPWLDETIMSVRNQTHADFAYLLLDDSSTDNSLEIARRHASEDRRLSVMPVHFRSVSNTRQAGVDQVNTEFVAFLDGDDRWRSDFLKSGP